MHVLALHIIIIIFSYFKWIFFKNQHGLTFVKDFQLQTALQSPTVHAYLLFDAHTTQNWKAFEKIKSSWVAECKKSRCIGCIFISDWKTTCFCRFPPKNYMRKNAYLDLKKQSNLKQMYPVFGLGG